MVRALLLSGVFALVAALAAALVTIDAGDAAAQDACDPAYPFVCIPPPPPDIDCGNIVYRDFTAEASDPHGFDADGDGVACESETFGPGQGENRPGDPAQDPGPAPEATTPPVQPETIVNAGAGPLPGGPGMWTLTIAGLAGAGIAWGAVGMAAASLRRREALPEPAADDGPYVPRMRPMGRQRR